MNEEIRTEEIMETETIETEDVKEGLSAVEYGVIGGIMLAGVAVWEGGKWVWKKTANPRSKVSGWIGTHKPGKKSKDTAEETPDQEGSTEKVETKSEEKKTESKAKTK